MIVTIRCQRDHSDLRLAFGQASPIIQVAGWSEPVATVDRIARFEVPALPAGDYYYGVEINGVLVRQPLGRIRVGGSDSFTFAFAGDRQTNSVSHVFDNIIAQNPDFFIWVGDLHYSDNTTNTEAAVRATYETAWRNSGVQKLLAAMPVAYIWDDHDFGPNDGDSTAPARSSALSVFRKVVPVETASADSSDAAYYTFDRGRCRFIVTDCRSTRSPKTDTDNSSKTMLGTEQKTWFKDLLQNSPGKLIFWVNSMPWIGAATASADWWAGYTTERTELADHIKAHCAGRIAILSADMHCIAFDDGTNSDYATGGGAAMPVMHAAPLDQVNSVRGGPYTTGPFDTNNHQWGLVTVADDGTDIDVTFNGYRRSVSTGLTVELCEETFTVTP